MNSESYLIHGLDALARSADLNYFVDGHRGGAIISGTYLCCEEPVEPDVPDLIAEGIDREWASTPLCAPFPDEPSDPALADRIVEAIRANSAGLRQVGHNIILPTLALKAFRDVPGAVTSARVDGICRMVESFTVSDVPQSDADLVIPDPAEATPFAAFALEEFVACVERFIERGQGWSGHLLTYSRALLDLHELGHEEAAHDAMGGFEIYIRRIRTGPQDSDKGRPEHEQTSRSPLQAEYWKERSGDWSLGHVLKYPYGYYGLLRHVDDPDLAARCEAVAYRVF